MCFDDAPELADAVRLLDSMRPSVLEVTVLERGKRISVESTRKALGGLLKVRPEPVDCSIGLRR